MAKEDFKGQFKSLAKRLGAGYSVKKLRRMSEDDLEDLLRMEDYMDEEMSTRRGLSTGGVATKKYMNPVTIVDNLKKKNK
tara:strand:- start:228 stop:467 length:240 start_codon:yes stop_codon:yes gene_type:complete